MIKNLLKDVLSKQGIIVPLLLPAKETRGTGLMNPSILNDYGKLLLNVRHVNYTLYHCEKETGQVFNNRYGPLAYINPENDITLRTWNHLCTLNNDFSINQHSLVDTSTFDTTPVWEFIGKEDARLFRWNNKLYAVGCRRDAEPVHTGVYGESRMDLSEWKVKNGKAYEVSRLKLEPPEIEGVKVSWCEKNWMPVLDMPWHFIKWTNPTEVVKVDKETGKSEQVYCGKDPIPGIGDLRGGSQVISVGDYRLAIVHEVNLWKNQLQQKEAKYSHRFVVWDKKWNIVKLSDKFSFMDAEIEFCVGMCMYRDQLMIAFGFQDNAAFLVSAPFKAFEEFIGMSLPEAKRDKFDSFNPVRVISCEAHADRIQGIEASLKENNITAKLEVFTKEFDSNVKVEGKYVSALSDSTKLSIASHLDTIKRWYNETNEPYLIVLEDDISFDTCRYWNFSFRDFLDYLPQDWDCIQLGYISDTMNTKITKRSGDLWAAMSYMITREYAGKLLGMYDRGDTWNLEVGDSNIQPHLENLLFLPGNTYSFPLFVENITFDSTILDRPNIEDHKKTHITSHDLVLNWWKNNGLSLRLKDIC